jgi:hypothetical protein
VADDDKTLVPVWTLATEDVRVPAITNKGPMTPQRLAELRTVLAALSQVVGGRAVDSVAIQSRNLVLRELLKANRFKPESIPATL